jgi:two-component system sensor histidine kinase/response regulator
VPYDLILMNVKMPEMDGYEATQKIRAMDNNLKNISIVAMTANAMKGDREKCRTAILLDNSLEYDRISGG